MEYRSRVRLGLQYPVHEDKGNADRCSSSVYRRGQCTVSAGVKRVPTIWRNAVCERERVDRRGSIPTVDDLAVRIFLW